MAKLTIKRYQNTNEHQPKAYGKWYSRLQHDETLTTSDLCKHIQKHGSIFTSDVVKGVVEKFVNCFEELLLEGYKLKLDGLGTFYLTAKTEGADSAGEFTADNVKRIYLRFLADQSKESEYTSMLLTNKAKVRITSGTGSSNGGSGGGSDEPIDENPE